MNPITQFRPGINMQSVYGDVIWMKENRWWISKCTLNALQLECNRIGQSTSRGGPQHRKNKYSPNSSNTVEDSWVTVNVKDESHVTIGAAELPQGLAGFFTGIYYLHKGLVMLA